MMVLDPLRASVALPGLLSCTEDRRSLLQPTTVRSNRSARRGTARAGPRFVSGNQLHLHISVVYPVSRCVSPLAPLYHRMCRIRYGVRDASKLLPTNLSAVNMRKVQCSAMVDVTDLGEETLFSIKVGSNAARAWRTPDGRCLATVHCDMRSNARGEHLQRRRTRQRWAVRI